MRFALFELRVYSVAMIVDLVNLETSPFRFEFSLTPAEIDLTGEEAKLKTAVRVEGELKKGIVETEVSGRIYAELEIECTRCLQTIERKLEIPFEAAFVTEENYTQAREAELGAKDLDVSVYDGQKIDITELVREQILLNLPEQIFCRDNCRGLCEKCGANRNLVDCNCIEKEIDPRWAALKNLK